MSNYIWIKGKRYYFWETYGSWKEAYSVARSMSRKNRKNKYYIQVTEGYFTGQKKYKLYVTKYARLRFF